MKKIGKWLCCGLLLVTMSACAAEPQVHEMYIEQAQLTEEEQSIAELFRGSNGYHIYDFFLDDTVKSIQVTVYELVDDTWENIIGQSGVGFQDANGRIMFEFDKVSNGMKLGIQGENYKKIGSHEKSVKDDFDGMGTATSYLSDRKEIVYEKEIPLAIQIITSKNEVHSYIVDFFSKPEEYAKYEYEHVYAITVLFSQNGLSDGMDYSYIGE